MVVIMNYLVLIYGIVSFIVTYFTTPWLIKYLKRIELLVKDQNKKDKPLVPISGGLAVLVGVFGGLLLFIFYRTFFFESRSGLIINDKNLMLIFASMISLLIITLIGFLDDLVIKRSKDNSIGLRQWQKPLLTLAAAVPLMVINAGSKEMWLPFIGTVNMGIIYPLILIPIGVVGASNMVNMLAGFNGMEAGMGIIYVGMLGLYAYINKSYIGAIISLVVLFSLMAFYLYNKYPAKILAGDSLTYFLGGFLAIIAIVGNLEKAAIISSIPFFIEFILKARHKFNAKSYGYYKNGKIQSWHKDKIYSLPHLFTRTGKFTEKQIVCFMIIIQLVFSSMIWLV